MKQKVDKLRILIALVKLNGNGDISLTVPNSNAISKKIDFDQKECEPMQNFSVNTFYDNMSKKRNSSNFSNLNQ